MTEYSKLRDANAARQKECDADNKISLVYWGNAIAGETGELCNVIKKIERERLGLKGSRATRADLVAELADIIIYADLLAMSEGVDLDSAVRNKFNATSEKLGLKTRLT